jgi:hypothetical protein
MLKNLSLSPCLCNGGPKSMSLMQLETLQTAAPYKYAPKNFTTFTPMGNQQAAELRAGDLALYYVCDGHV